MHHRYSTIAALFTIALATSALAAPTLPGINIRWDNCYADGGVMNKSFACDTNSGSELMVLSVQLDSDMDRVSGVELRVSLKPAAPALPAWWDFMSAGSCRQTSLVYIPSPMLPEGNCQDWGQGLEQGALPSTGYHVGAIGPGSAVAFPIAAVPQSTLQTLSAGIEYVVGALRMNHAKSVGDACAGCATPVCILFTSLKLTTSLPRADRLLTQGANDVASQVIHWQNGQLTNLVNHCNGTFDCSTQFDCLAIASTTAARRNTWGAVKALYR